MAHPLLRPRWVAAHLVLAAVLTAFVSLGFWQLRRLHDVDTANARITARLALPVGSAATALSADGDHRRAQLRGTYDTANEWILLQRSHRGIAGHHVLTPLRTSSGAVVVDRGWVPLAEDEPPVAVAAPPAGEVTVEGVLLRPPPRGRFGPRTIDQGRTSFRIEPDRIARAAGYDVAPLYLHLVAQAPAQPGEYPIAAPRAALDRGPHLSYALQWFAFAVAAAGTYGAFAVRSLRRTG